jgi:hypothetical protein
MDDEARLLLILSKEGCMTLREVSKRLYVDRKRVELVLSALIEKGRVIKKRVFDGVLYCFSCPDCFSDGFSCSSEALMSALLEVLKGHRGRYAAIRPIKLAKKCAWGYPSKSQIVRAARFLSQYKYALVDRKRWVFDLEKLRHYIQV